MYLTKVYTELFDKCFDMLLITPSIQSQHPYMYTQLLIFPVLKKPTQKLAISLLLRANEYGSISTRPVHWEVRGGLFEPPFTIVDSFLMNR